MKRLFYLLAAVVSVLMPAGMLVGCDETEPVKPDEPEIPEEPVDILDKITDPVFGDYCSARMDEWDTDGDGKLSPEEAGAVKRIDVGNEDSWEGERVASLAGIEHFTGLATLYCYNTDITTLDVSACTELVYLNCRSSALTELNVSECGKLERLWCFDNELTVLDVSTCAALTELGCDDNALAALDVSKNPGLEVLNCRKNVLSSLDISSCTALWSFLCDGNPGDGKVFAVNAPFDNDSVPSSLVTVGSWDYEGSTISVEYRISVALN